VHALHDRGRHQRVGQLRIDEDREERDDRRAKEERYEELLARSGLHIPEPSIERAWNWVKCNFDWLVRAVLQPFFHIYFRLSRIGREHLPADGPVIIAANHRSFLDPFVIATMARRPMYYVAKKELFNKRWQAWVLTALGAFPVDRGANDTDMIDTAKAILARGDIVLIFAEGTRIRPGALGQPKRGVGRLAL